MSLHTLRHVACGPRSQPSPTGPRTSRGWVQWLTPEVRWPTLTATEPSRDGGTRAPRLSIFERLRMPRGTLGRPMTRFASVLKKCSCVPRPQAIIANILEEAMTARVVGASDAPPVAAPVPRTRTGAGRQRLRTVEADPCARWPLCLPCFPSLPLSAWPTDARMHPTQGTQGCLFGCAGSSDDLTH